MRRKRDREKGSDGEKEREKETDRDSWPDLAGSNARGIRINPSCRDSSGPQGSGTHIALDCIGRKYF